MSDFKAKMHLIQFWLGLRPKLRWGSLQRSRDPLAGFNGPTSKAREGKSWRMGGEKEGRGRNEKGRERGEEKERKRGRRMEGAHIEMKAP